MEACRDTFSSKPEGKQLKSQIKHLSSEIKQVDQSISNKEFQIEQIV